MNGRELHEAVYAGEKVDRLPLSGLGAWTETLERWQREGLGADESPSRALGLEADEVVGLPLNLNMCPLFPLQILEKEPDFVRLVDEFGVTLRMRRVDFDRSEGYMRASGAVSSMSHWVGFPVGDTRTWKTIYEERFRATVDGRLPADWPTTRTQWREQSRTRWVTHFSFPFGGLFSAVRQLMGLEGTAFAMADDPQFVHTIVDDLSTFYLEAFSLFGSDLRLDQVTCFEDMCSNRAPLVSPGMFQEFFAPAYRKYIGGLKDLGVKHVTMDTDGDARLIIPQLLACGFSGVHPCEVKAGMDVGEIRRQYPTLYLNGGIDKRAVANGGKALEEEMARRFRTAWECGRYTPGLDHSAPPDISWANAQRYAELFAGWCRSPEGPTSS